MERIIGVLTQLNLESGVLDSGLSSVLNSWLSCLINQTHVNGSRVQRGGSGKDNDELDDLEEKES